MWPKWASFLSQIFFWCFWTWSLVAPFNQQLITGLWVDLDFLASFSFFFLSHPYPYISSSHSTSPVNSIYKLFTKSFLSIIPSLPCLHLCKPSSSFGLKYNKRVFNGPPCFQESIPTLQMEWLFWHSQFYFPCGGMESKPLRMIHRPFIIWPVPAFPAWTFTLSINSHSHTSVPLPKLFPLVKMPFSHDYVEQTLMYPLKPNLSITILMNYLKSAFHP